MTQDPQQSDHVCTELCMLNSHGTDWEWFAKTSAALSQLHGRFTAGGCSG